MQATIRLQLTPSQETTKILTNTIEQYTWAFNDVAYYGWHNNLSNGIKLHDATYRFHRGVTDLPSQLVCSARVKAGEAIKSARALKRKGKRVTFPYAKTCPIRYDARSYTVWWNKRELSLTTIKGRLKFSFEIADYYHQYLEWKTASADLLKDRQGRWCCT